MSEVIYVVEKGIKDEVSEKYYSELIGIFSDKLKANNAMDNKDFSLTTYVLENGNYIVHVREDEDGGYYRRTIN